MTVCSDSVFSFFRWPCLGKHMLGGRCMQDYEPVRVRPFTTPQTLLSKRLNAAAFPRECSREPPTA